MVFQQVTASSLVSPVPRSQAEIDNEIATLTERVRALQTQRNSLSPISSIPPEILGAVFIHLARQVQSLYPPSSPAVLSWLNVAHVCCHWRKVAIANPHLWATPFLGSLKVTEEMLMRSKLAPLILRTGPQYRTECVQKVFEHAERLQEVSLDCSNREMHHILELLGKLSSCSAPSLRSLSLDGGRSQVPLITIPTSFMAPNLRRLQISHCNLSWTSPILTGVTVLDINTVSDEFRPTLDGLISALRRMPALHTLSLEGALPKFGTRSLPREPHTMNVVQLPLLERLRLVGKISEVANVLARVKLPVSTRLEVQFGFSHEYSNKGWNAGLPIISRALESCFKATPDKFRQTACSMRLSGNDHFRLQYGTVRHPTSWVRSTPEAPMEWTSECPVTLDFPSDESRTVIKKIWRLVPLQRLEALYMEDWPHVPWDGFWIDVLGHTARNLSYIYLRAASHLLEDLFKSMRSRDLKHSVSRNVENHSRRRPILSPALSHLILEHMEFSEFVPPLDLLDVLIDRVNDGRGLDKLTIIECTGIDSRDVQLFREVVADVEWDGYEGSDDYEFDYDYDSFDDDSHYNYAF